MNELDEREQVMAWIDDTMTVCAGADHGKEWRNTASTTQRKRLHNTIQAIARAGNAVSLSEFSEAVKSLGIVDFGDESPVYVRAFVDGALSDGDIDPTCPIYRIQWR